MVIASSLAICFRTNIVYGSGVSKLKHLPIGTYEDTFYNTYLHTMSLPKTIYTNFSLFTLYICEWRGKNNHPLTSLPIQIEF